MVDFNSGETLGANKDHIIILILFEKRQEINEYIETFKIANFENRSSKETLFNKLRFKLENLEFQLRQVLKRKLKKDYAEYYKDLKNIKNIEDIENSLEKIEEVLDELRITKIDNKRYVDYTNIEESNKAKGF